MITRKIEVSKVTVFEKKRPQKLFWLLQEQCCDLGACMRPVRPFIQWRASRANKPQER